MHFTHLLRVDASTAGGLVFCERFCGGFFRRAQFFQRNGFFRHACLCGRGNLNLTEQRRGRTNRLGVFSRGHSYGGCGRRLRFRRLRFSLLHGSRSALPRRRLSLFRRCRLGRGRLRRSDYRRRDRFWSCGLGGCRLGCSRLGCFRRRGLLAGFLFGGAHALQGAEQLQAQVLVQTERRVGVLRHRGGVQAHTLRVRRSGGGQGAGAKTHQVSRGGHARGRARRILTLNSLTSPSACSLNSLLSRSRYGFRYTGFRARRSAPSRTLRRRSNTRKGARSDRANTLLHRNLPGTATLRAAALRLRRKGHYASQPATLDSHARDAGIASR